MKICLREMLTDVVRAIVNNIFKESFYGKKINILTIFFLFLIKVVSKLF